jgi:cytochrome P450
MADALITLHAEEHRQRRIIEMGVFGRGFFRSYAKEVFTPILAELLAPAIAAGGTDVIELGYRVSMNLTADFAGIDRPEGTVEETEALLAMVKTFSEGATLVHSTRDPVAVNAEVDAAMSRFERRFFRASLERRRNLVDSLEQGRITADVLPRDVLTTLLKARGKLPLADDVLRREMSFFLQAGAHSTTNSTAHALHEICQWANEDPARWSRLSDQAFVQRCVHESLRLHPASPVAWRRAVADCEVNGEAIVSGQLVEINLAVANMDQDIYGTDADMFNPDRKPAADAWPWGLSFGYGTHACLGRDLDGGIVMSESSDDPHPGIVPTLVHALLASGARPDDADPPLQDTRTSRRNWSRYPVIFRGNPR